MIEFKFRAWDKVNKKMIQSENILKICFLGKNHTPNLIVYSNRVINDYTDIKEEDKIYCEDFELIQYTGFKDRYDREIYEDDILWDEVEDEYCTIELQGHEYIAVYEHYITSLIECYDSLRAEGNIYENKELIGDED